MALASNLLVLRYHGFHHVLRPRLLRAAGTESVDELRRVVALTEGSRRAAVLLPALLAMPKRSVVDFVASHQRFDDGQFPWSHFSQSHLDMMLHAAARSGKTALVTALLDGGNRNGDGGGDPLAQNQLALESAVREGHLEAVEAMLCWLWDRHTVQRAKAKEKKRTMDKVKRLMANPAVKERYGHDDVDVWRMH